MPRVTDVMRRQRRNNADTDTKALYRRGLAAVLAQHLISNVIYVIQKQHQTSVDAVAATLTHKLVGVGPTNATHVAVRKTFLFC